MHIRISIKNIFPDLIAILARHPWGSLPENPKWQNISIKLMKGMQGSHCDLFKAAKDFVGMCSSIPRCFFTNTVYFLTTHWRNNTAVYFSRISMCGESICHFRCFLLLSGRLLQGGRAWIANRSDFSFLDRCSYIDLVVFSCIEWPLYLFSFMVGPWTFWTPLNPSYSQLS